MGQVHLQITGFRIHQEGGERVGVTQEQHVRQRHITPIETGEMQTHHQYGQCVDQSFGGIRTKVACKQCAIRQGELQMLGYQNGFQRFAFAIMTTGDHGDWLYCRQLQLLQSTQQLVFAFGDVAGDFLHCVNVVTHVHETHHVPGYASRKVGKKVLRPCCQRLFPRQGKHLRIRTRCGDLQCARFCGLRGRVLGLHGSGFQHTRIHLGQFNRFHVLTIYPLTYPVS